jgi:DNA-directed RNA polymerase specialized sigma24 family protein
MGDVRNLDAPSGIELESTADSVIFDDVFDHESASLVRLATLLTGSFAVAEEVVQEAFVGLLRKWETVEVPAVYLRTAVLNGCRSHGRRLAVARRHAPRFQPVVAIDGEPDVMHDAVARLPHRQRAAVVLRYWLDLSERDIADHLSCRPGTVKSLLSRALDSLREEVQK